MIVELITGETRRYNVESVKIKDGQLIITTAMKAGTGDMARRSKEIHYIYLDIIENVTMELQAVKTPEFTQSDEWPGWRLKTPEFAPPGEWPGGSMPRKAPCFPVKTINDNITMPDIQYFR